MESHQSILKNNTGRESFIALLITDKAGYKIHPHFHLLNSPRINRIGAKSRDNTKVDIMDNKQPMLIAILLSMIKILQSLIEILQTKTVKKGFEEFAEALGKRESNNNYKIINVYGFMGRWQFGMARLCDLGYTERKVGTTNYANSSFQWKKGYSQEYFLNNPDFQDRIFREHCNNLMKQIKLKFLSYFGKTINGIKITLSGCVAGAHLGGVGGLTAFIIFEYNDCDAFGTTIGDYIKEFGGYNLTE